MFDKILAKGIVAWRDDKDAEFVFNFSSGGSSNSETTRESNYLKITIPETIATKYKGKVACVFAGQWMGIFEPGDEPAPKHERWIVEINSPVLVDKRTESFYAGNPGYQPNETWPKW